MQAINDFSVKSVDYADFANMPEDYQQYVIRILSMQAYAEKLGAEEMGYQLRLAPDARARKGLARVVSDEANHAYMLYTILERLGVKEEEAIAIAEGRNKDNSEKTQSMVGVMHVGHNDNGWLDMILNNMLMDRAGGFMVENFCHSSFSPWAQACTSILKDEQWHKAFGLKQFELYMKSCSQDASLTETFSRWFVHALNFFGPPSKRTQAKLEYYGIKRQSNESLRQAFIADIQSLLAERGWQDLILDSIDYTYPVSMT